MIDAYVGVFKVADLYLLEAGKTIEFGDALASTGTYNGDKLIVTPFTSDYDSSDFIGFSDTKITDDYPDSHREISVVWHGPIVVKVGEDVLAGQDLTIGPDQYTELFDGDGSTLQVLELGPAPITNVVSVTEDPTGTPTVLTEVSGTPTTNQYSVDLEKSKITIGGTSVTGTDNYEIVYDVEVSRPIPLVKEVSESITFTPDDAPLSHPIDYPLLVNATAGSSTGIKTPIYSGTPGTGEVLVDRANQQLTFNSTDAITAADVVYKTAYKLIAKAIGKATAGNKAVVWAKGGAN